MDKQIEISIVVPVFNEVSLIEELVLRLKVVCDQLNQPYEIVIVDDGSSDGSYDMLKQVQAKESALRRATIRRGCFGDACRNTRRRRVIWTVLR